MKVPPEEIRGGQIKLRPVKADDLEAIHRYASDPEVTEHMVWGPNKDLTETERNLQMVLKRYQKGDASEVDWAVERLSDGVFLGRCGLHHQDGDTIRVGCTLDKAYWGMGCGTEVLELLFQASFEHYGFQRVIGTCHVNNVASERIMQKAGMQYVGVKEILIRRGIYRDSKVYEIFR